MFTAPISMDRNEFLNRFEETFAGRRDVYAVGKAHRDPDKAALGKLEYFPRYEPLTTEHLLAHTKGELRVGVYPLSEAHQVKWFALDFDGDNYEEAATEAKAQRQVLEAAGLHIYTERSQSGKGIHLWGFFDEWVNADALREAVLPMFLKQTTGDRMFPVQSAALSGKQLGNLIALPFYNAKPPQPNAMFLDDDGEVIPPKDFLATVRYNTPAVLSRLVPLRNVTEAGATPIYDGPIGDGRPGTLLRGWLKAQSAYGCQFLHKAFAERKSLKEPAWYVAIQQATCFTNGRAIAHAISKDYPGYSRVEVDAKFSHATQAPVAGCDYIREHFPEMACPNCPNRKPYQHADKTILELVQESDSGMAHGGYEDALAEAFAYDDGEISSGHKIGIDGLDDYYTLRRAEFTIVAARPSMGKTAFMVDASNRLAMGGIPVLRFSAETGKRGLMARDLGWMADVNTEALRGDRRQGQLIVRLTNEEKDRLNAAAPALNSLPCYSNYTALDPDKILLIIEDELLKQGIPLDSHYVVMFDYIQYGVKYSGETNYERVSRLSAQFKSLAKILNCSVIAFAQLGRGAEEEEPNLSDLKESGALEQDADAVILLHGERDANMKSARALIIKKQREGRTGNVQTILHKDTCHFESAHAYAPVQGPDGLPDIANPFTLTSETDDNDD